MTGGMAFIYDPENIFESYANPTSIIWQKPETKFWIDKLKKLLKKEYTEETNQNFKSYFDNFQRK